MISSIAVAILSIETIFAITPITYMQDTTVSYGLSTYSGRPIQAEYVTNSSILVGKQIDTIIVQLKKIGSPTGNAIIGIFNPDLSVKKTFANVNASTLAPFYKNYTFSLASSSQPYTIQIGDRLGIKYTGGDSSNFIAIITDQNTADPFDGANSYLTYYTSKWYNYLNSDLYMTLRITDTKPPVITLLGSNPVTVQLGSAYVDGGATAYDNVDGDITSSIVVTNPVNTNAIGTYTITYNVKDSSGNTATPVTRTVNVISTKVPTIYMQDFTASSGLSVYSGRPIQTEYVNNSSILVGKQIDTIAVQLKKIGSPTGNAVIGIFNSDLSIKKTFANVNASTLTTSYSNYTFSLPSSSQPYLVQAGDRIGIKYTGGDSSNYISVMTDQNTVDPFDGTNSYLTYYTTAWNNFSTYDLCMSLQLNSTVITPIIYMKDTTASYGLTTYTGRPVMSEYITSTSSLLGKQIDTMIVRIQKEGSAIGSVQIGVFSNNLSVKKLFGTINASTIATSYQDYAFSLSKSVQPYQIQSGDRIGVKFSGGSSSNNVSVMTDQSGTFNGKSSYLSYYTTAWNDYTSDDLYMTLALADNVPPVITLVGSNPATIEIGTKYIDAGATAYDFPDGDLTSSIIVTNPVNTSVLGTYVIIYNVSDKLGNAATPITRTVNVVDTTPPTISITSPLNNTIITGPSTGVKVNLNGPSFDAGSGIKKVEISNGTAFQMAIPKTANDWSSWNGTVTITKQGLIPISARATDNVGNQMSFTVPVTIQFSGPNTIDKLGNAKLFPTKTNGRQWFSTWNNGHARTIIGGNRDPYDSTFVLTGSNSPKVIIYGNGTANLSGGEPRMFVNDPNGVLLWQNTEVTVYEKRVSETDTSSSSGINIGARSLHYGNNGCGDDTYYSRMLYNGVGNFAKELKEPDDVKEPSAVNPLDWNGSGGGILPHNTWVGHKFVLRTMDNGTHVRMQMYRDMTDGLNGGIWHLEVDYTDNGNMYVPPNTCGTPLNKIILDANPSIFIRNTDISSAMYKKFDAREINPLP